MGLDAKSGEVATDGWLVGSGRSVAEVAGSFADTGVDAFVVTDIGRDGTLGGPDIVGLTEILGVTKTDVIASGGVGNLDDLLESSTAYRGQGSPAQRCDSREGAL